MTFEQFQATKKRETRDAYAAKIGVDPEFITASHVLTYHDGTAYIEDANAGRRRPLEPRMGDGPRALDDGDALMDYKTAPDWKPLERAHVDERERVNMAKEIARLQKISVEDARQRLDAYEAGSEYWVNNLYQVQVRRFPAEKSAHLNIRRRDGKAIFRDWRHFQWIKNQLVGPECEAIELYPAESRLVDASNKYHLWCVTDPTFRFPVGMDERDVDYSRGGETNGTRQRPL